MRRLLTALPDLPTEVERLLRQIPRGRVTTYGDLARALGDVAAARWVGEYLLDHPHPTGCPCHRVVRQGGDVGLFITGRPHEKSDLLRGEGVQVEQDRALPTDRPFVDFESSSPLRRLREQQEVLPERIELRSLAPQPRSVAGVDVSYASPALGIAAYVRLDAATREVIWSTTVTAQVVFPYIPGYLTYRELPLHVRLFEEVRRHSQEADVTFVDGNGILHPRRAGSASACGVAVETPTIGIGKKLLCGSVDLKDLPPRQPRPVLREGECLGMALSAGERNRPFYISPGHRCDLAGAVAVSLQMLGRQRLPLPITLADRLSREQAVRVRAGLES